MSKVPLTVADFIARLAEEAPGARPVVDEHLADHDGDLLLHVLVADLGRYSLSAFAAGDSAAASAVVGVMDLGFRDGDDQVANAVAVSFVESIGPWTSSAQPFISSWPDALREDARQVGGPE